MWLRDNGPTAANSDIENALRGWANMRSSGPTGGEASNSDLPISNHVTSEPCSYVSVEIELNKRMGGRPSTLLPGKWRAIHRVGFFAAITNTYPAVAGAEVASAQCAQSRARDCLL